MLSFVEISLAESLAASVRDVAATAIPPAVAAGVTLALVAIVVSRLRHPSRRGHRSLPATV